MKTLKALALLTVPVVGAFVCLLLFQLSGVVKLASIDESSLSMNAANLVTDADSAVKTFKTAGDTANVTIRKAGITLDGASAVLKTVNRPCGNGKPCGTLADVARTLNTFRLTAGQIEIAANHEDRNLATLDAQELQLFTDTHTMIGSANDLVSSPFIKASLQNIEASSASIADGTKQADAILVDARIEADKFTHPPKKKLGFWGTVLAGGDAARHFMPPLF
jgi:hypothetical protein